MHAKMSKVLLGIFISAAFFSFAVDKEYCPNPLPPIRPPIRPPISVRLQPVVSTTAIIEVFQEGEFLGIVLIERRNEPFGMALPGGKVKYKEEVELALRREMMEEVNLELYDVRQFHVYSEPLRDYRHHTIEVTHTAKTNRMPIAGDDAAAAFVVRVDQIPWDDLAFDHAQILRDWLAYKNGDTGKEMIKP